jgi:hypothetical protein
MLLFRRGEMLSTSSPPPGESKTVIVVAPQGEEYHVVAAVEGHELETPEAEHRPRLKRLLKTPHLELNGKAFVNTQQSPTWRANCRRFGPGGSLDRRVNLSLRAPAQMGWCEMEHKRWDNPCIILHQGARSRGYKHVARGREREGARSFAPSPARTPLQDGPGPPFYRRKERVQMYNGGCSYALTCLAEKCLSPMYMPTWLSGESLSPAFMITWPSEKRLSPMKAQLACGKDPADVSLLP